MKILNTLLTCSLLLVGTCVVSCGSDSHSQAVVDENSTRVITFDDFTVTSGVIGDTKATQTTKYLKVVDVCQGAVKQTIERSLEAGDDVLAPLSMEMNYGRHEVYFVCSENSWSSFDESGLTLSWDASKAALSDVWGAHITLDVNATSPASQSVAMDRLVAYLQVAINDAIPSDVVSFASTLTGGSWTLNLPTMSGAISGTVGRTVPVPAEKIGQTGVTVGLFTFVPEGATSATRFEFSARNAANGVVASRTFSNVPIAANHYTKFSGNFFSGESGISLSVNADWGAPTIINY